MSKQRPVLSITAIVGMLIVVAGAGIWTLPSRALAQAAAGKSTENGNPARVITAIQPVEAVPIVYPPEAQAAGIKGKVGLRVRINKDGSVQDIQVLSGPPELVEASLESVSKWRYAPSNSDRVTIVTIVFSPFMHPLLVLREPMRKQPRPSEVPALEPISAVRPVYPPLAKTADVQGKVVLRVTVGEDGSVSDIKVVSGHPLLVKAALVAVQRWRYAPMNKPVLTDVTLDFTLPKGDRADSSVTPPMLIYRPNPSYPQEAKDAKLEGNVVLQVLVAADGTVSDVKVTKSLDKGLDESAVQTVKTWKFLPAVKEGKPVPCKTTVSVNFKHS